VRGDSGDKFQIIFLIHNILSAAKSNTSYWYSALMLIKLIGSLPFFVGKLLESIQHFFKSILQFFSIRHVFISLELFIKPILFISAISRLSSCGKFKLCVPERKIPSYKKHSFIVIYNFIILKVKLIWRRMETTGDDPKKWKKNFQSFGWDFLKMLRMIMGKQKRRVRSSFR